MNETRTDTIYMALLKYFNVYTLYDDVMEPRGGYVSMDNIHDACIIVGLEFDKPLNYYTVKAKQLAINEHNVEKRRREIIEYNAPDLMGKDFDFEVIEEYGFSEIELDLILERLAGIPQYKSSIPRRRYNTILRGIKEKVKHTLTL